MPLAKVPQIKNQLLAALPAEEYERLSPYLNPVSLDFGQTLYEADLPIEQAYFPSNCIVSLLCTSETRATVEVGTVGNEGMVGLPVVLGVNTTFNRAVVQSPGEALSIKAVVLKEEFDRGEVLQTLLHRYTYALLTMFSLSASCNRFHKVEQRFARWLLVYHDRTHADQFQLTHEIIARLLGVRRASVSEVAGGFQNAGLIRYHRGRITILRRKKLEAITCRCYRIAKEEYDRSLH
ncbi:MAG: Crp/Fnr family transcriptional regulator [Pyrinomonadaceae bacterium]|nr:Crp/Fnr family transcriptional regulator [Pyrinomonadaceae bacterium]